MDKRFIFAAAIYLILAPPWCYGQAERNPQTASGQINEAPLKEILQIVSKAYKRVALPSSVMVIIKIEQNGSISRSSIKVIKSYGDRMADETGKQMLWLLSESHILGGFYGLSSITVEVEISEAALTLQITGFSPSESEAMTKVDMLRQVIMDVTRKAEKNSEIDKLLRSLIIRNRQTRVEMELNMSWAELLK